MLLDAAEKLVGVEFVFAGRGAAQQADVQHDDVPASRLDAVQYIAKMIERVMIADRDENISGTRSHAFGRQLAFKREIELVHFHVRAAVRRAARKS